MAHIAYDEKVNLNIAGITASEIEDILPHWNTKITEIYNYKNNNYYEILFLISAKTEDEIKQWVKDYEEKCKCSYSIRSSEKCSGTRVISKLRLYCQHNTDYALPDPDSGAKRRKTRNTNCPSNISITLQCIKKRFQGRDRTKAPNPELPCQVKLIPHHNHATLTPEALRCRTVSDETKEKLLKLYECGHSPGTALESIKIEIQLKFEEFEDVLADRAVCPDYMYCYHLYMTTFKRKFEPVEPTREFLERKVAEFNDVHGEGALIEFVMDRFVICLCPPSAKRVHENIETASEIVTMESRGAIGHEGNCLYLLSTPSECGYLPLGAIITSTESEELIAVGFELLKNIVQDSLFGGSIAGPKIFVTDDSPVEQLALQLTWPSSACALSNFHVLRSVWRWLTRSKNGVKREDQVPLFQQFRDILYAADESECEMAYKVALVSAKNYPNYFSCLNAYWGSRKLWALCYHNYLQQQSFVQQLHETDPKLEACMRFATESIFERISTFNFIQKIDFMFTRFFYCYERRLLEAAYGRITNVVHDSITLPAPELIAQMQHVSDTIHVVPTSGPKEKNLNLMFTVNTEVLVCTCNYGRKGHVCKHIYWICCYLQPERYVRAVDNGAVRRKFYFVATGCQPTMGWLEAPPDVDGWVDDYASDSDVKDVKVPPEQMLDGNIEQIVIIADSDEDPLLVKGVETLNEVNAELFQYLKKSPVEVGLALEVFKENLQKIKTVAGFASACRTFSANKRWIV